MIEITNLSTVLSVKPSAGYALLDSGDNEKLERYGEFIFRRPDPQALWNKNLPEKEWAKAHASFRRDGKKGDWNLAKNLPARWKIEFGSSDLSGSGLQFWIRPTSFKHTGLFPEQLSNWKWMTEKINNNKSEGQNLKSQDPIKVLNLFGYTGGATLACAQAGTEVCHVDGSKVAIQWARDNAAISGLSSKPIRWILDDARDFVKRELKRGRKYDGIILDPPAFGHGPHKELWQIGDHLVPLLKLCREVMTETPLFFLLNGYASGYSAIAYANNLQELFKNNGGMFEKGELTIAEESGRLLPCGIFARWSKN
ncbi:MAG: hypothetical protein A2821_04610 [Candidatus Magasanikbacteria bacterium RIFCSPHIGHO2_01_FULL_41_23]|uniref:Uncharacterized protein n=1 Tax=Candidatus Magasanikbacteria bacterium RIFCSPLOWO2_01_FULL_40_15 TaxID=1798686 RepID=A0A1F6N4Y2_9BACT|nr:MAG: hypothetical protein A2821_04610 [Candidatus Magasanikbacteria bacterium RIFCSPHIGHO2_01_FULL_41_23]OGH67204.1 MAG: hypothetical protein A3C66_02920 [Candidatus Magasanikbacteria bacterium RIFCSPHIGHO2_02_FULL_41_35]OGH75430.1 MAG: hypothetical protein A3F22_01220 [Candidatus Magasanikbacteria bacterium RIFCSPHIGHO2_12_FULL_41_16]OGH78740.1 MAG: hypothetical protein A2983_04560 [Candidatus Magasanikbacteria bacterium RIFCSPLOWO2_01_FULL_40_15]